MNAEKRAFIPHRHRLTRKLPRAQKGTLFRHRCSSKDLKKGAKDYIKTLNQEEKKKKQTMAVISRVARKNMPKIFTQN